MIPKPDEWEEWTASPVAQWFFGEFLPGEVARTFGAFAVRGWGACPNPTEHAKMRERADVLRWLARARLADFLAAIEDQEALAEEMKKLLKD
nr:hypothetical protein [uncultured archaeon]